MEIKREETFLLLVSHSTHFVMKVEKILQNNKIWCRIILLPREISAGCGMSVRCNLEDRDKIENILSQQEIEIEKYIVHKKGLKKEVEKI